EKQKGSRGIRRGQRYRLVFQFPIREQAAEKAQEARAKVMNLIQAEKRAEARAARKARDHALYQSAGLLILAGLVDSKTGKPVDDTAALLGALASLNDLSRDNPKWSDWKIRGQELLNSKKSDSTT
ncbi:conjugal transfer protein TraD, partial [Escherichia coli]